MRAMTFRLFQNGEGEWKCEKVESGKISVLDVDVEYRVYDRDGQFYAGASSREEATRYLEQPGDRLTISYTIQEAFNE